MGQYLIPGAVSTKEAAAFVDDTFTGGREWTLVEGGVLFSDPTRSDTECAALYSGFASSGNADFEWPLPDNVRTHLQHLRDYLADDAPTNAESVHVIKDLIRAVHYLNRRFEAEG